MGKANIMYKYTETLPVLFIFLVCEIHKSDLYSHCLLSIAIADLDRFPEAAYFSIHPSP